MRRATLKEQYENCIHLEDDACKYPLVINVPAGEDPGVGYPGEDLRAPIEPGTYTLWHVVEHSTHLFWWWEKEA